MHALGRIVLGLIFAGSIGASGQARTSAPSAAAQPARAQSGTLVIAGEQDQAPLVHMNGRSYVDVESLARMTHATVRYAGSQIVLTLPGASQPAQNTAAAQPATATPQLSAAFLGAEIEALTAIREWRVSLVNAVQSNAPLAENWLGPLRRFAEARLQLAVGAASTEPDQRTLDLLRNEFTNMQQESDSFLAMRTRVNFIPTDSFDNNAQDQKILTCQRALAQVAASKQFQDDPACH